VSREPILWTSFLFLLAACSSAPRLPDAVASDTILIPGGETLEMTLDDGGVVAETEFHVTFERLPEAVRRAADTELPGGTLLSCEKEYHGSTVYWEVEKLFGDLKKEILFTSDGRVRITEFQISAGSAPRRVMESVERVVPGGDLTSVEEVTEGAVKTYHVKKEANRIRYKLILAPDGKLLGKLREVQAEIEVPVP
jgi:hypothetical protein